MSIFEKKGGLMVERYAVGGGVCVGGGVGTSRRLSYSNGTRRHPAHPAIYVTEIIFTRTRSLALQQSTVASYPFFSLLSVLITALQAVSHQLHQLHKRIPVQLLLLQPQPNN